MVTMKVLGLLTCLVVLWQVNGVFSYGNEVVNRCSKNHNERMKRFHESDCHNIKHIDIKKKRNARSVAQLLPLLPNVIPKSIINVNLPMNEMNGPKDVKDILSDIATIAQNKNNTKGIQQIRHLVDVIANHDDNGHIAELDVIKTPKKEQSVSTNVKTVLKYVEPITAIETKETVKSDSAKKTTQSPKNEQHVTKNTTVILKSVPPKTEAKAEEPVTIIPYTITVKEPTTVDNENIKYTSEIKDDNPLFSNGRRIINNFMDHGGEKIRSALKDDNLIKLKEHEYEEVLIQKPYAEQSTYKSYNGQNFYYGYGNGNTYTRNGNYDDNYNRNGYNYPSTTTYRDNNGNRKYYDETFNEFNSLNQGTSDVNKDYKRYSKTCVDRDTVIGINSNEQQVKSINEDRKEVTNIQSPDFYKKYYSVTQKQCSGDNGVIQNFKYSY